MVRVNLIEWDDPDKMNPEWTRPQCWEVALPTRHEKQLFCPWMLCGRSQKHRNMMNRQYRDGWIDWCLDQMNSFRPSGCVKFSSVDSTGFRRRRMASRPRGPTRCPVFSSYWWSDVRCSAFWLIRCWEHVKNRWEGFQIWRNMAHEGCLEESPTGFHDWFNFVIFVVLLLHTVFFAGRTIFRDNQFYTPYVVMFCSATDSCKMWRCMCLIMEKK